MAKADIDNLIEALTSSLDSIVQYYDRQTGEVVALSDEFGNRWIGGTRGALLGDHAAVGERALSNYGGFR